MRCTASSCWFYSGVCGADSCSKPTAGRATIYATTSLHPDFGNPEKGSQCSITIGDTHSERYDTSLTVGDVIYGFRDGELAFAGEVVGLRTRPSNQALLVSPDGKTQVALAVARVVVTRMDVSALRQPQWRQLAARLLAVHESGRRPDVPIAHVAWRMPRQFGDDPMTDTLDATAVPLSPEERERFEKTMRRHG